MFVVYQTDWVGPDGMTHSAIPTDYSYYTYEEAKAKAKELNDNYKLTMKS